MNIFINEKNTNFEETSLVEVKLTKSCNNDVGAKKTQVLLLNSNISSFFV